MKQIVLISFFFLTLISCSQSEKKLTQFVNPFLGTAPLQDSIDCGYNPPRDWRVWAGLTYPGATLPNAMVQLSPITEWHSGAGYEYEDNVIYAFTHTNKGHWNLCHIPIFPVTEDFTANDFGSQFSHENESAEPGYYRVKLDRYGINAELTTTLRCGYHKYNYPKDKPQKIIVNLSQSNERVRDWNIEQEGTNVIKGFQQTGEKIYFYAETNRAIENLETIGDGRRKITVVSFDDKDSNSEVFGHLAEKLPTCLHLEHVP